MLTRAEIQHLRSLREKRRREESGLFVVEGPKVVGELLAAGLAFTEVLATPDWAGPAGVEVKRVTPDEMARISHFPTPSAVLAVGRISRPALPEGALARGLTLALDGVQDPGNVGTLIRIADWFAFDRVLLSPDCADLFHQKVINASMGSFARVPVHVMELPKALAPDAAGRTPEVIGCDLDGEDHVRLPPLRDAVVVIGAEGRGLSAETKPLLTRRVTIPRLGKAESLNAAVAAGIICAHLRRSGN
ncbi:MAG: TrmH family RNA methyltransferase [Opitutaceae bacterium]